MVEITETDADGICDGQCITYSECSAPAYEGWETVHNGTCRIGTVCCAEQTDTATETGTKELILPDTDTITDPDGICDGVCITFTECSGSGYEGWEVVNDGTCGHGTVCCVES